VVDGKSQRKVNYTKLNVDASFYAEYFSGATGAVIRDDHGGFVEGSCCSLPSVADVVSAEARALGDGLLLAGQVGYSKLIVNSDCMKLSLQCKMEEILLERLRRSMKSARFFPSVFHMLFLSIVLGKVIK
jgi:hypothetical protein